MSGSASFQSVKKILIRSARSSLLALHSIGTAEAEMVFPGSTKK